MKTLNFDNPELIQLIKDGKVGILPTDTIYGIHASANSKEAIERMYKIRLRDATKPFLILISSIHELENFNITLSDFQKDMILKISKDPVSFVLPVSDPIFEYLARGTKSLGFRIPQYKPLNELLRATGPLASTSVNKQGEKPLETIQEAETVFENLIDFAVDVGPLFGKPSTIVEVQNQGVKVLRQGGKTIPNKYLIK